MQQRTPEENKMLLGSLIQRMNSDRQGGNQQLRARSYGEQASPDIVGAPYEAPQKAPIEAPEVEGQQEMGGGSGMPPVTKMQVIHAIMQDRARDMAQMHKEQMDQRKDIARSRDITARRLMGMT